MRLTQEPLGQELELKSAGHGAHYADPASRTHVTLIFQRK